VDDSPHLLAHVPELDRLDRRQRDSLLGWAGQKGFITLATGFTTCAVSVTSAVLVHKM